MGLGLLSGENSGLHGESRSAFFGNKKMSNLVSELAPMPVINLQYELEVPKRVKHHFILVLASAVEIKGAEEINDIICRWYMKNQSIPWYFFNRIIIILFIHFLDLFFFNFNVPRINDIL